jgi:hypothetical protein
LIGDVDFGPAKRWTPFSREVIMRGAALVASLIHPPLWRKFHAGAVGPYAVTPEAWDEIQAAAE